ncbi:trypsin-like peptidase domain-containing protein [Kribbella sp. NBC_01484]|uniref:trypsin-like peptidase domain-containing protein n=1 Tax=Kribbella sp. NBC_01484 TaxID=2903579 RepID=UPI002E32A322|nr:trypsin-like peptidase domain-containing protein [Kribbella sp. NBC_01484]
MVEVIADLGESLAERYRYGSGCIVRGRTVLTAAHVVTGAVAVQVRGQDKRLFPATVDARFVGEVDGPRPDLALVEIDDVALDLPPIGLARVDRDSPTGEPVERCHAVGYPWFAVVPSPQRVRDTVDALGVVPVLSKLARGALSMQVSASPRPLPPERIGLGESEWSGMSGAPVISGGLLLGVVTEHAPREGTSAITAIPLTALEPDPLHENWGEGVDDPSAWWSRLGVSGLDELRRLPAREERPEPAYWETLREFGRTLHQRMPQLLGRGQELADIAAFATGAAGYRWLVGGAYVGKTALLYETVTVGLPPEVDVVCYFLSRRASDADSDRFLDATVPQLAYLCEVDPPVADRDQFAALWRQAVDRANGLGRHLLLVVDGLDEDRRPPGSASVASLLPTLVGAHAHVLVASRPNPDLPVDVPNGHALRAADPAKLQPFEGAKELAHRARQEIDDLTHGDDVDLAVDVLGLLTAAGGPLSVTDLATLSNGLAAPSASHTRQVRRLVAERAARSLEPVGSIGQPRYQFAHYSLLEYAQTTDDLCDPEYRDRIHQWAEQWRATGWPVTTGGTPAYLLDSYPGTLTAEPDRLTALVRDAGWVNAAIQSAGADVTAAIRQAATANPTDAAVRAMLATVTRQAHYLKRSQPLAQAGYVLRQLWLQAAELTEDSLANDLHARLQADPGGLLPLWTTRRASSRMAAELGRHDRAVTAVVVLPDGQVVTGGADNRVLLWDSATPGAQPVELGRHDDRVWAVAVLTDGRVVTGGEDNRVLLWDPVTRGGEPVELGRHDDIVAAVAVLPDGRVVTGGWDNRILLWDPATPGGEPVELGRHDSHGRHGSTVAAVAVLPDGRVVTGGGDSRVLLWDPATAGAEPVELGRHLSAVAAVAVLPDGQVVTGGGDNRVLLWDPATPGAEPVQLGRHDDMVSAMAVLPDGQVVTGGWDNRILLWDPVTPGAEPVQLGRHDDRVWAVAVLPDGRVVTGAADNRVLLWNPATPGSEPVELDRHDGEVKAVAMLPGGRVVTGVGDRVLLWDPATPGAEPVELGRHDGMVWVVAVLPDGRVVTGGADNRILLWDPATPGAEPVELGRHDGMVWVVAVLTDGRVVTGGADNRILLWDPATPGAEPVELGRHDGMVWVVAVLTDGRVVTGGGDDRILLWDPATPGAEPVELGRHDGEVVAVAVLPDGRVVTGGVDNRVLLWDPATPGAEPNELGRQDDRVSAVAVLTDGRVVTGGFDQGVRVWDLTTRGEVARVGSSVRALATWVDSDGESYLVIAHSGAGLSFWLVTDQSPGPTPP